MPHARFAPLLLLVCCAACAPQPPAAQAPPPAAPAENDAAEVFAAAKLDLKHLPNAVRVHDQVISGGLPDGEAGFAELKAIGVKTVISVDGAKPDVALAEKFGLRYAHLPHGYDGIPEQRSRELAKAVSELPGPVYIHCHHGKHRSPVAAAVACVGAGLIGHEHALDTLEIAGTSKSYRGLYEAASKIKPFDKQQLSDLPADFPSVIEPSPMAEAMVALEHTHDHLQQLETNGWQAIATKPDLDWAHEALLLREHFTEMLRTDEVQAQPKAFVDLLRSSEAAAKELEDALEAWSKAGKPEKVPAEAQAALERVSKDCKACHQAFRDVPLSEKQPK